MSGLISAALGRYIKKLASSLGASLIGILPAGVGAFVMTVERWMLLQQQSVFNFMTDAQRAAVLAGTAMDVTSAFNAAIATGNAFTVPGGLVYQLSGPLKIAKRMTAVGDRATLNFTGLADGDDGVSLIASYARVSGFLINMNQTGRHGLVVQRGDYPKASDIQVLSSRKDGVSFYCGMDWDWIENGMFDGVRVTNCGRHGWSMILDGIGGEVGLAHQFINECHFVNCETRGFGALEDGAVGFYSEIKSSNTSSKISGMHWSGNHDAQKGSTTKTLGPAMMLCRFIAGANNVYEAYDIGPGGWESTTGTVPFPYLIKVEAGANAAGWFVRGLVPYQYAGYSGLNDGCVVLDKQNNRVKIWGTHEIINPATGSVAITSSPSGVTVRNGGALQVIGANQTTVGTTAATDYGLVTNFAYRSTGAQMAFSVAGVTGANNEWLRIRTSGDITHAQDTKIVINARSQLCLTSYTVATLPPADSLGAMINVTNGAGGLRLAICDGSAWRFANGVVVS